MLITDIPPQPPRVITQTGLQTVGRNSDSELRRMERGEEHPAQLSLRPTRAGRVQLKLATMYSEFPVIGYAQSV